MAECPDCGGGGKVTCDGRGCDQGRIWCPKCNGGAKIGPGETCGLCENAFKMNCPLCEGEGLLTCKRCEGSGRVD